MSLVKRNMKSFGRMGSKMDWKPIGMSLVTRNLKSFGRMVNKTEQKKNGMKKPKKKE